MRALVTGGCGFIGSNLVDLLVTKGHDVTVLDDLSTGRLENLSQHSGSDQVRVVQESVEDLDAVAEAATGCDTIFHLAALADIVPSIENPSRYFRVNVDGSLNVADVARRKGVKKVVYAASSSCYGVARQFPTSEAAEIRPEYPYALTKWLAEETLLHWSRVYGVPTISLRLFNVYGPRARTSGTYGAVFGVFLAQKFAGQPLTIVGDGRQSRDFTHVRDVTRAFLLAAESPLRSGILNVGTGTARSVNDLAALIGGPTVNIPKRPGEPDITLSDSTCARTFLSWSPEVDFETGVREMLANLSDWSESPVWTPKTIAEQTQSWFEYLGDPQ